MEEQMEIEEMNQTQHPPWLVTTNYSAMKEKRTHGMTARESNTCEWEGKYAFQQ